MAGRPTGNARSAAIFDLDGTLADTMPVHYRVWIEIAARYGIDFPEEKFYSMGGIPTAKIAAILAAEQSLSFDALAVAREKEQLVLQRVGEVLPISAVVEIARRRRQEGPIAIASGGSRAMVERTLRQIELYDWFPVVVTAEDTVRHKPEPDVFLEAARRMGVPAEIWDWRQQAAPVCGGSTCDRCIHARESRLSMRPRAARFSESALRRARRPDFRDHARWSTPPRAPGPYS
jgi:beta-phosphoglucomutase-like phosphatase (HAD superfamily)